MQFNLVNDQGPVVQTMDSAIRQINTIQWISHSEINCAIQWIVIYPADSAIHRLNNWGQEQVAQFVRRGVAWCSVAGRGISVRVCCGGA